MIYKKGDIVRITKEGDVWDGILAKFLSYDSFIIYIEILEWGKFLGPYRDKYEWPRKGAVEDFSEDDLVAVSPLEQLALAKEGK